MRDRLILLPGWGLGISPLEPLAVALRGLDAHLRVEIEPLPVLASAQLDDWLDELDAALPDDVWLGAGHWVACWPANWPCGAASGVAGW